MLTSTLLSSAILVGTAIAAPQPQQIRFQEFEAPQGLNRLKQDLEGAWDKVHKSVDDWVEQGVRKFNEVEHDGINYELIQHAEYPSHSLHMNKVEQLCDTSSKSYSGYLRTDQDANLFYWFFESRSKNPEKDPLVLWINGGPGCSSMTGLLFELGPCSIANGGKNTTYNPYSWTESANVVFLDSPVQVGYSYGGKTVSNSQDTALDIYAFFQLFYEKFPKFKEVPFHIAGESYAGTYLPNIGSQIHAFNQKKPTPSAVTIPLESIMIGNGLTDAYTQFASIPEWSCDKGGNPLGPIFDEQTCASIRGKVGTCQSLTKYCYDSPSRFTCVPATLACWQIAGPIQNSGLNPYDISKKCDRDGEDGPLCYKEMEWIEVYMNQPEVRKALGVSKERSFESCNMQVNKNFMLQGDVAHNTAALIPPLLEDGIRFLTYSGNLDFMCNSRGNLAWTLALPWVGQNEYVTAKEKTYTTRDGKKAGVTRSVGKGAGLFRWLELANSGHMHPHDQPEVSLDWFTRWLRNEQI
ncbi:S10 family peptidase [Sporobolomyces salmoneus]|uniref:S10 family peptidase n=1 Tax=Sporobolomyces salmoneus TaxID=183962 RepID=UPI00316D3DD8